jgi:hypothetical protein
MASPIRGQLTEIIEALEAHSIGRFDDQNQTKMFQFISPTSFYGSWRAGFSFDESLRTASPTQREIQINAIEQVAASVKYGASSCKLKRSHRVGANCIHLHENTN